MRRMWIAMGFSLIWCIPALWAAANTTSAQASASTGHQATTERWAPENLKGTISMVDPNMHLVVVRDSSGVPFDFKVARSTRIDKVARSTRIDAGRQREALSQLAPNESVSVHFVPEARGDIARTIQVNQ